uniref:Uncharacterized protein n=1 Tax=viral metagenome TaxID=1070528 RepID=A0A6M3LPN7_9ZZZZ
MGGLMRLRTAIVLLIATFNALWLAHVFLVLYLQGYYPISEPVKWIAAGELVFCLVVASLSIERLAHLKEHR